jgi:preprotein translocase subunit SecD
VVLAASACAVAVVTGCGASPSPAPSLQIRPVLDEQPGAGSDCAATAAQQPAAATSVRACTPDGEFAFRLGPAAVSGAEFTNLEVGTASPPGSGVVVYATLDPVGAKAFADLTAALAGKSAPQNQFAFYAQGQVQSAPAVQAQIAGDQLVIAGFGTTADAQRFVDGLRS